MALVIEELCTATAENWDLIWQACPYATFFHSREWAEIWERYSNRRLSPAPLVFRFSDNREALFPLSIRAQFRGVLQEYVSSPAGTFGGWLSVDTLSLEHCWMMMEHVRKRKAGLTLRLNPYDPMSTRLSFEGATADDTHVLDLRAGYDAVYRGISRGHRSAAKQASKSGVVVAEASCDQDWVDYYSVYEDSLRRWGSNVTSRYKIELFTDIGRRRSPNVKLWLARYRGEVIAGALCFYSSTHVVYWHGAALERYFPLRGPNLLLEEAIRQACEQGYHWFDFNPSGGHEGPRAFKQHFGAKALPCPMIRTKNARCE